MVNVIELSFCLFVGGGRGGEGKRGEKKQSLCVVDTTSEVQQKTSQSGRLGSALLRSPSYLEVVDHRFRRFR